MAPSSINNDHDEVLGEDEVEAAPAADDSALNHIRVLAETHKALAAELADLEALAKTVSQSMLLIVEKDLPDALTAVGMKSFELADGFEVAVEEKLYASITKEKEPAAFNYLRDIAPDLLKRSVGMLFGRGEEPLANEALAALSNAFPERGIEDKTTVVNSTLVAWLNEQRRQGISVQEDLFGVYQRRFATITPPKKPRAKAAPKPKKDA